jgi:hypothetical protein
VSETRDLKCQCCKCYDSFDGCTAFDCQYDFEIAITKVKAISRESGMSVEAIVALIQAEEDRRNAMHVDDYRTGDKVADNNNFVHEDFNPYHDSNFLISFADATDIGKKMLIEMHPEDLKRLRAEIDNILKLKEIE